VGEKKVDGQKGEEAQSTSDQGSVVYRNGIKEGNTNNQRTRQEQEILTVKYCFSTPSATLLNKRFIKNRHDSRQRCL
jgi:hypothetical protein